MLMGVKNPYRQILAENEVTQGWKEIRWDLKTADVGRSEQWGMIMNYLRFFARATEFGLDLYIDNLRLVGPAPQDATGTGGR